MGERVEVAHLPRERCCVARRVEALHRRHDGRGEDGELVLVALILLEDAADALRQAHLVDVELSKAGPKRVSSRPAWGRLVWSSRPVWHTLAAPHSASATTNSSKSRPVAQPRTALIAVLPVPLEVECREEGRLGIEQREAQPDGWQPPARHAREGPHLGASHAREGSHRQLADDLARGEVMQEDLDGQLRHAVAGLGRHLGWRHRRHRRGSLRAVACVDRPAADQPLVVARQLRLEGPEHDLHCGLVDDALAPRPQPLARRGRHQVLLQHLLEALGQRVGCIALVAHLAKPRVGTGERQLHQRLQELVQLECAVGGLGRLGKLAALAAIRAVGALGAEDTLHARHRKALGRQADVPRQCVQLCL
eukprot:scaffold2842_cov60-Phaeocystis_antarctica.AAC.3